jgi:hypothetical protein
MEQVRSYAAAGARRVARRRTQFAPLACALILRTVSPKRAQQGKVTPGYELLKHVTEGDLVFHWWMRPKSKELRGFYGYSTVVGSVPSPATIVVQVVAKSFYHLLWELSLADWP